MNEFICISNINTDEKVENEQFSCCIQHHCTGVVVFILSFCAHQNAHTKITSLVIASAAAAAIAVITTATTATVLHVIYGNVFTYHQWYFFFISAITLCMMKWFYYLSMTLSQYFQFISEQSVSTFWVRVKKISRDKKPTNNKIVKNLVLEWINSIDFFSLLHETIFAFVLFHFI